MPGFVIHVAIGKEYVRKHKNEIRNEKEFLKGILAPDLISLRNKEISKELTHYGKWNFKDIKINLDKFLEDKKVDLNNDYWKGYFIHLLTDEDFYLNSFKMETLELIKNNDSYYYDYDCLNKKIITRYDINKFNNEAIDKYMKFVEGKPKYLKEDKIIQFIDNFSNIDIYKKIEEIKGGY